MSFKNEKEEHILDLLAETDYAYKVFDGTVKCWIPKSQVEEIRPQREKTIVLEIPNWLAESKGLI